MDQNLDLYCVVVEAGGRYLRKSGGASIAQEGMFVLDLTLTILRRLDLPVLPPVTSTIVLLIDAILEPARFMPGL